MNQNQQQNLSAGLGMRREFTDALLDMPETPLDFIEVAPENWMAMGGRNAKRLARATERFPLFCHGLSLSIGSPAPLDEAFVKRLKTFLDDNEIVCYSEHLSYCSDDGHLYDLMPIPFTDEAVNYVSERIQRVQDLLKRRLVIENVSYYAAPGQMMQEIDFINAIMQKADCELLLDVNNVYVNSINHRYDPAEYIKALPTERIAYMHVAGHYKEADDLIVDTHGADVIDPVWSLLDLSYQTHGPRPTLLERDFNIPPLETLFEEIQTIKQLQQPYLETGHVKAAG